MQSVTSHAIATLFTKPVSACVATLAMFDAPLWPGEEKAISCAVLKRRREFCAGRAASRQALSELGAQPGPILMNSDRTPHWPSGFLGSISHCDRLCVAVVARTADATSLGLDVELAHPLPIETTRLIYDQDEAALFARLPSAAGVDWGKLAFSAKEAFYKCYYHHTKTFLEFREVAISFSTEGEKKGSFFISIKGDRMPFHGQEDQFSGRWMIDREIICAGVTLTENV